MLHNQNSKLASDSSHPCSVLSHPSHMQMKAFKNLLAIRREDCSG